MEINVNHVAKLAKLSLTQAEAAEMEAKLSSILDYVSHLQEVDTSGVDANAYLTSATNVFRDDVIAMPDGRAAKVRAAFPKSAGTALEVPAIFDR
jgi:aspartyl-tRNA(Asn)/glutamyl-tRNA(Gln) amidotransferase subunit C